MKILFWASLIIIFYVYFGYPLLVYLLSFFVRKPLEKGDIYPEVSILISAYNEDENIERKIRSLLELDYPKEKMEILIGSDGSGDRTDEIVSGYTGKGVRLYRQGERQGKPSVLNMLAKEAKGEIIVFTDARQKLGKSSLKELVRNFKDERVGSVSSGMIFEKEDNKPGRGIGLYWRYEKFIRSCESKTGSMLGATGAMYAIRKELFSEMPKDLILDDVYIPLKAVQKGYRAVFEPEAKIYDRMVRNSKEEFLRKSRTLAGNFQAFGYLKWAFNPFKSPIAWQIFSHKLMRLFVPYFLIAFFISNMFILDVYFYRIIFILQVIFYGLALFGLIFTVPSRILGVPFMFCVMNSAAVTGLFRFLRGRQSVMWNTRKRSLA